MKIRDAIDADFPAITSIYAHHVLNGCGSFEEEAPQIPAMLARFNAVTSSGLPWLVAELAGEIAGFAYAQRFHPRSGWRLTLENSVYVSASHERNGIGRALMQQLLPRCAALGYAEMIAVIGDSANAGSIGLHHALGFEHAGHLRNVGLKFGKRLDVIYMQKTLGP